MATLTTYIGTDTLKNSWPIWKQNTINVNTQLVNHVAGTADNHDADAIAYDNTTSGLTATDTQAAIDELQSEKLSDVMDANTGTGIGDINFYTCTAAEYAAIVSKDASTIYFVV